MPINLKLLSAVVPLAIATAVPLSSQATVRDHRETASQSVAPTETRLDLRVGQPLKLDGGKSLILRPGGVLEIIEMNGRVPRTFHDATIIEDGNGVVWIIAPNNITRGRRIKDSSDGTSNTILTGERMRAGLLQRTSPLSRSAERDRRATALQMVAPTDTRLNLRPGQPLKLAGGKSLILRPGGIIEIIGTNGRVVRTFQFASIVEDRRGVIWIVSGDRRVRAGVTAPNLEESEEHRDISF